MKNNQNIGNISNSCVSNVNVFIEKYSIKDVVDMINKGDVKISVDTITGLHGATYVKAPAVYDNNDGEWSYTTFNFDNNQYSIATIKVGKTNWYHFVQILKMINLLVHDSDIRAFEARIPYECKRCYSPFGRGIKRTFVTDEVFGCFGLSIDGKPIVKRKVSLQYSGVTVYNVNMPYLKNNVKRIMNKLNDLDDKMFMCDVYRTLSQLE